MAAEGKIDLVVGVAPEPSLLRKWINERLTAARAAYRAAGRQFACEHLDLSDLTEAANWFVQYPEAFVCDDCAVAVYGILAHRCDYCGDEGHELARYGGHVIRAVTVLCWVCEGADEVPA